MGREVRMVPPDWKHPKNANGKYIPLYGESYRKAAEEWVRGFLAWETGADPNKETYGEKYRYYWEWSSPPPEEGNYMPDFQPESRTHYQMYEDTSEGTPISPVMESPEALARWLVDNKASAFGNDTATYDQWLTVARGRYAPSAVMTVNPDGTGIMESGVAAMSRLKE